MKSADCEKLSKILFKIISDRYTSSGGNNGVYAPELMRESGKSWKEVRQALKPLYEGKEIRVRDGSKGNLFMLNKPKIK